MKIRNWRQFARYVRSKGCNLLAELDNFPNAVLVTGCQRSGTTMVARVIFQSEGMVNYWSGKDDELDAALILSGNLGRDLPEGRYCFQTTYLNECYREYYEHQGIFRMIWVLRNPYSVINSMLYNWSGFALNELFDACGAQFLSDVERVRYERFGRIMINPAKRASLAYHGKLMQLFELYEKVGENLYIVDYDDLVQNKTAILREIYSFIDHPFKEAYAEPISVRSLSKANKLPDRVRRIIDKHALPVYQDALCLLRNQSF